MIQLMVLSASARICCTRSRGEGCGKAGHRDALPTGLAGGAGHRDAGHKNAEPTGLDGFDGHSEAGHEDAGHRDALPTVA